MRIIVSTLALLFLLSTQVSSQAETKSYEEVLKELMIMQGSEETFTAVVQQMVDMFKTQESNAVPEKFWDEMEREMKESGIDELTKMLVPVYQKHLTLEDLQAIIAFYNTPVGKKYAEKTPLITQESMQVGQLWGAEIGSRIAQKIKDEGY